MTKRAEHQALITNVQVKQQNVTKNQRAYCFALHG